MKRRSDIEAQQEHKGYEDGRSMSMSELDAAVFGERPRMADGAYVSDAYMRGMGRAWDECSDKIAKGES